MRPSCSGFFLLIYTFSYFDILKLKSLKFSNLRCFSRYMVSITTQLSINSFVNKAMMIVRWRLVSATLISRILSYFRELSILFVVHEKYFLRRLNEYNSYYANANGWNPSKSCKATLISKGPADKCCGEYPMRYPFNSEDGARDCCNGKTFNALRNMSK